MSKGLPTILAALAWSLAAISPAAGQSTLQVSVLANGVSSNIAPGGTAALTSTGIGQAITSTATIRYAGTTSASITGISSSGSTAITLLSAPAFPVVLTPGGTTSFTIQYLPAVGTSVSSLIAIGFTENAQPSVFSFNATGSAPDLAFTYFFAPDGVLTTLNAGDRITFPTTNLGSTASAVIHVLNRGSAAGSLQSIAVTGADYQVTGSPAPTSVPAGQQASFTVVFTPHASGTSSGLLTVGVNNTNAIFQLAGLGAASSLAVSYSLADGNVHTFFDGSIISFPSVDINATTTATFTVVNQGTGAGTVAGVSVAGAGFQLTNLPILPATLATGQSLKFSVVFAPTQAGIFSGAVRITLNSSTISATLAASTNPSNLTATYALADGNAHPLIDGGIVSLPSVDVNTTTTATVTILNQGSGAGTVTGISVAGTGFQLTGLPVLPATLGANQTLKFGIAFTTSQPGSFTGTFRIDLAGRSISGTLTASTSSPNFTATYALADGIIRQLPDGTAIAFPSVDVNANSTAAITILNQGPGTGTITGITVSGTGFQVSGAPQLPATVASGQSVRFNIVFSPAKTGSFTGTFRLDLTGRSISGTLAAATAVSSFSLSYIDPDTTNVLPLSNGSALQFPNTLTGTTSVINLVATNAGAGTGAINSITLGSTTSAFQLLNLPALPASVPPAQQFRFAIRFNPQQQQSSTDILRIDFNGQVTTVNLQGQATQPQYTYAFSNGQNPTIVPSAGTVTLPDTSVGQTSSVAFSILNSGTGDGSIANISVTGQGFTLTDLPTVPFTLHPNGSQRFTLNFAPSQPGAVNGRLTIGADTFTITGTGIGSRLVYTYTSAASAISVADGGVVIFPPLPVGNTENLTFSIQNTGTSTATISSISLAAATPIFSIGQMPALPMNLDPGANITISIGFVPNNTGSLTSTLRVNSSSFTLSGSGTQPTSLPAYKFQGPSANQQPAQQSPVGLTLSSPYPFALQGTLKLTFVSDVFTDDPSIQFASGGRSINFTIPANTTQALFGTSATSISLQTGTTAGNIVITPSFAMQGGFDLTPSTPDVLNLTIPRSAPQLLNASISGQTLSSFTVVLSGYSTTRVIRQLDIQITPKSGQNFSVSHLTIDVSSTSAAWFQSTAAQGFGGSFLVAIPFTLSNGSTTDDLVHLLQSLSITATNDVGASSAVSVAIQ